MSKIVVLQGIKIDVDRLGREVAKQLIKDDKRKKEYFNSKEFRGLVEIIRRYEHISGERLKYKSDNIEGLTAKQFSKVCDTVFYNIPPVAEKKTEFPTYHVDYEGIRFHLAIGQGSAYWTTSEKGSGVPKTNKKLSTSELQTRLR